jgi:hypothetical protein
LGKFIVIEWSYRNVGEGRIITKSVCFRFSFDGQIVDEDVAVRFLLCRSNVKIKPELPLSTVAQTGTQHKKETKKRAYPLRYAL